MKGNADGASDEVGQSVQPAGPLNGNNGLAAFEYDNLTEESCTRIVPHRLTRTLSG